MKDNDLAISRHQPVKSGPQRPPRAGAKCPVVGRGETDDFSATAEASARLQQHLA